MFTFCIDWSLSIHHFAITIKKTMPSIEQITFNTLNHSCASESDLAQSCRTSKHRIGIPRHCSCDIPRNSWMILISLFVNPTISTIIFSRWQYESRYVLLRCNNSITTVTLRTFHSRSAKESSTNLFSLWRSMGIVPLLPYFTFLKFSCVRSVNIMVQAIPKSCIAKFVEAPRLMAPTL